MNRKKSIPSPKRTLTTPEHPERERLSAAYKPTHEEIARFAYELYLSRSSKPGQAMDDWLRAEREIAAKGMPESVGVA